MSDSGGEEAADATDPAAPPEIREDEPPPPTLSWPDVGSAAQLDITRRGALWWMLVVFGLVLVFGGTTSAVGGEMWTHAKEFLGMVLPYLTGLLGTAIGFYFGRQRPP